MAGAGVIRMEPDVAQEKLRGVEPTTTETWDLLRYGNGTAKVVVAPFPGWSM
jgi:hypothetical protein